MPGDKVPVFDPPRKPRDFPPRPFVDDRGLEWRDVPTYEGRYLLSETADVLSLRTGRAMVCYKTGDRSAAFWVHLSCGKRSGTRMLRVDQLAIDVFGKSPQWCDAPRQRKVLRGEALPYVLITDKQVRQARMDVLEAGRSPVDVASDLGVTYTAVMSWVNGKVRREAGGPINPCFKRRSRKKEAVQRATELDPEPTTQHKSHWPWTPDQP